MATTWKAPTWRMPNDKNQSKFESYSIDFNGMDPLNCGNSDTLDIASSNYSISTWVKYTTTNNQVVCEKGSNNQLALQIGGSGNQGKISWIGGADFVVTSANTINDGNWHHVCCVAYGSSSILYIDGQISATGGSKTQVANTSNFMIGGRGTSYHFTGSMSQLCLFNYDLSSAQVSSLYNSGSPINPMTLKPAPIAYYPLGGNASTGGDSSNTLSVPNIAVPDASVFNFDGVNDYVIANPIDITGNKSVSMWFKTPSASTTQGVFEIQPDPNTSDYLMVWIYNSKILASANSNNSSSKLSSVLLNNTWYNLVITKSAGQVEKIYINGQDDTQAGTAFLGFVGGRGNTYLGATYQGTGYANELNGFISNAQVWNIELSSSDITTLYNNGQPLMTGTQPQAANLKGWWKLNQSANWEAETAGNWQIPDARSTYPQSFDFVPNGYIDLGTQSALNLTGDMTISAWINTDTVSSGADVIVCDCNSGANSSQFCLEINRTPGKISALANGNTVALTGSTTLSINRWYHVVLVRYGTTGNWNYLIYLDSVVDGSGNTTANPDSQQGAAIGRFGKSSSGYFNGQISNVQIWNTALSSSQIETLYNNGTPLTTAIASDNLKAWYKLNDNEKFDGTNWSVENQKYPAGFDSALDFIKSESDNVTFGTVSGLVGANDASVSVWFKADVGSSSASEGILDTRAGNIRGHGPEIYYQPSTNSIKYTWGITSPSQGYFSATIDSSIVEGQWYNVIVALDVSGTPEIKTYLNGVLKTTNSLISYSMSGSLGNLTIGSRSGGTAYYDGAISNASIFNKKLDLTAAQLIYNNGTPETSISESPTNWWKLDNLTTGIQDSVGSNDGTNNGATKVNTFVSTEAGVSSGMTEQNLVNNNVSALNGESSGMTSANLVTSTLTRQVPYNSYSLNFDGTNDYVDCGSPSIFDNLTSLSVSCWFNSDLKSQDRGILGKWLSGTDRSFALNLENSGNIRFVVRNSSTAASTYINTSDWSTGNWYNIIGTYDGTNVKLYLDGVLKDTASLTGTVLNTTHPFRIGKYHDHLSPFNGKISNVSFFNEALTSTEVVKLYNSGVPSDLSSFNPQPIAWWSLGSDSYYNGANYICPDLISTNNGTSSGMGANAIVGNAPKSTANGTSANMTIDANLTGSAPNSSNNSFSVNMSFDDRETNVPS